MRSVNHYKCAIRKIVMTMTIICLTWPVIALADEQDPASRAASKFRSILFGGFGTSLCTIFIGVTFLMAKTGKITWDRFMFIGFCTAGFLGSDAIVRIIKSAVY